MTKEEMQALQAMFEAEREHTAKMVKDITHASEQRMSAMMDTKLQPIKDDLEVIKEESAITRHSVNLLLKWAERADRSVNVGLYDQAK